MAIPAGLLQKILQGIGRVGKKVNRINPLRGAVRKPVPDYMREGTLGAPGRFYDSGADNFFDLFRPPNPNRAGSGYRPFATPTDPSKFAAPGSPLSARAKAAIDPGVSPMWGGPPFENPLSTEVARRGAPPRTSMNNFREARRRGLGETPGDDNYEFRALLERLRRKGKKV